MKAIQQASKRAIMIPGRRRPKNQYKALHIKLVPPSMASSLHDRTLCGEENGADVRYVVFPFEIRERILQLISFRAASFSCAITESISTRVWFFVPLISFIRQHSLLHRRRRCAKLAQLFAFSSYLFPRSFRSSSVCFSPPQFVVVFPLRCSCSRSIMKNALRLALLLCSCLAVTSAAGPTSRGQIDPLVMTRSYLLSPSIFGCWFLDLHLVR